MLPTDDQGVLWDPTTQKGAFGDASSTEMLYSGAAGSEQVTAAFMKMFCCTPPGAGDGPSLLDAGLSFVDAASGVGHGAADAGSRDVPPPRADDDLLVGYEREEMTLGGIAETPAHLTKPRAGDRSRRVVPIVLVGDADVGKSAFVKRYVLREYLDEPPMFKAVVVDIMPVDLLIGDNTTITIEFHDITQSIFEYPQELRSEHEESLEQAEALLLVCDLTRLDETLAVSAGWHDAAMQHTAAPAWVVVNKADAAALTPEDSAQLDDFCTHNGLNGWCCSSAAKDFGIEEPVNDVLRTLGLLDPVDEARGAATHVGDQGEETAPRLPPPGASIELQPTNVLTL